MTLVFNILSIEKGAWQVLANGQIIFSHNFNIVRGEDKSLLHLQKLLDNNNLKLVNFKGCVLLVKDASMTQVKIFTTIINTLAWQFDWPLVADYYFQEDSEKMLAKVLKKLAKLKKFTAISPAYSREADISISKKQPKYKIAK
jgi:hypothetical protein